MIPKKNNTERQKALNFNGLTIKENIVFKGTGKNFFKSNQITNMLADRITFSNFNKDGQLDMNLQHQQQQ